MHPAHIQLRNGQGGDFIIAQSHQFKEFEFFEFAPQMEGQSALEWTTGGVVNYSTRNWNSTQ
jgi:hypothetical protein